MKIRYGLVLAIAIVLGGTGCASGGGAATEPVDVGGSGGSLIQGERPRNTDNTRAAERALEDGDEAENEAEARVHYEHAAASAAAAIAEDMTNPLAHRLAAMAALALEDYEAAGLHFDHAAELRPLFGIEDEGRRELKWIDLYQIAAPLVQSGDYEGAAEVFEDANAIYSRRPESMITLGQIYAQMGRHDLALENLDNAVELIEGDAIMEVDSATAASWREQAVDIPLLRAQILSADGRFEEAAGAYRALSEADPENLGLAKDLATILIQMGNEAEALTVYEELMSRPGLSGEDYYAIGVGFYQASDYGQASQAFGGAADASPLDRDALEMWARSMQLDAAYADLPPVVERWIELDPSSQNAYLILAQAANQEGDQEVTQDAIRQVEALEVSVDQLQLERLPGGGGAVSGSLTNKTLTQGASVAIRFTFYSVGGDPIGTVTESVSVAAESMAEIFQIQFDSAEYVGGYGYEVTIG